MTKEEAARNLGARLGNSVVVTFEILDQLHTYTAKLVGVSLKGIKLEGLFWLYFEGPIKIKRVSIEKEVIYRAP
ncbi:hypothetical protein J7K92_01515 [bacterium]|nr:hypothetical protein [bacterium]